LLAEVPVNTFSSAQTILRGSPSQNVVMITLYKLNISNSLECLVIKNIGYEVSIPGAGIREHRSEIVAGRGNVSNR
jgi:hypothetical protein